MQTAKHSGWVTMLLAALSLAAVAADVPLATVGDVDIQRYLGTWHQIALFPNRFQSHCVSDTTAEYSARADGNIEVRNQCRDASGKIDEAVGLARQNARYQRASILQVRFAPAWLSFLPWVWGDYWIIALEPDYSAVLVGAPNREYLWVLAREKTLSKDVFARLKAKAVEQGFAAERLTEEPGAVQ